MNITRNQLLLSVILLALSAFSVQAQCPHPVVNSTWPPINNSANPEVVRGTILVTLDITPNPPCNFVGVNIWLDSVLFPPGAGCQIGQPGNSCIGQDVSAPYAILVDTTKITNGAHKLKIDVYDQFDDSFGASISIIVDNPALPPDTQAPQVAIQSPGDEHQLGNGQYATVAITNSVADNFGVTQVDMLVNGELAFTSMVAPYGFNFKPKRQGVYQVQLRAWDGAGNSALSNLVTVIK